MTDNETRYREALEEIFDEGRHDMAWQIAKNALNPPQEPQFEEVEVVEWKALYPNKDAFDLLCDTEARCDEEVLLGAKAGLVCIKVKLTGTYHRPVKPKVRRREELKVIRGTAELLNIPRPDATVYQEWEE